MRGRRILLIVVLAGTFVPVGTAAPAAPSFAIRPLSYDPALPETKSYFVFDALPGSVTTDRLRVVNVGTGRGSVKLYAVDATTGQTSGTVYLDTKARRRDVGRWVGLATRSLTLRPHQSSVVSFTLRVPVGARSGDHVGGIVAENRLLTKAARGHGSVRIRIRHLTVAAVVVRIPGRTAPSVGVRRVGATGGHGYQFVLLDLLNGGNVMMKPTGSLVVRSAAGTALARNPLRFDTLIPKTTIEYPVLVRHALRPGRYTASVILHYGNRVLVNGQGIGGPLTYRRTLGFSVSKAQNTQVYVGVPPQTRLALAAAGSGSGSRSFLFLLTIAFGILALAALVFALIVLRRRRTDP